MKPLTQSRLINTWQLKAALLPGQGVVLFWSTIAVAKETEAGARKDVECPPA